MDNEDLLADTVHAKKRVPPARRHEKVALIEPPAGISGVETDVFGGTGGGADQVRNDQKKIAETLRSAHKTELNDEARDEHLGCMWGGGGGQSAILLL